MHGRRILRNTAFSVGSKMIVLMLGFITRKVFLLHLGDEILGVNSVYSNILDLLNMSEFGISGAIQYRLYRPLAEKNYKEINNLLYYARRLFSYIGIFILCMGLIFTFFIQYIIGKTEYDLSLVRISFFLYVVNIAVSYFFTHRRLFLQTNEELYLVNIADTIMNIFFSVFRIFAIAFLESYLVYAGSLAVQTLGSNILISIFCKQKHPEMKEAAVDAEVTKGILSDLKYVMPQKISWYVYRSTDNLVIAKCIGLLSAALYSNYMMAVSNLTLLYSQVVNIAGASLGILKNELDNKELFRKKIRQMEMLNFIVSSVCAVELYCLLDSLIFVWLGETYVLDKTIGLFLSIEVFFFMSYQPLSIVFSITGKFREDYKITLLIALLNIIISVILSGQIGIAGVIMGTLFCDISSLILRSHGIVFQYFGESKKSYGLFWLKNICSLIICFVSAVLITAPFLSHPSWGRLILSAVIILFLTIGILFLLYRKDPYFDENIRWAKEYFKRKDHGSRA